MANIPYYYRSVFADKIFGSGANILWIGHSQAQNLGYLPPYSVIRLLDVTWKGITCTGINGTGNGNECEAGSSSQITPGTLDAIDGVTPLTFWPSPFTSPIVAATGNVANGATIAQYAFYGNGTRRSQFRGGAWYTPSDGGIRRSRLACYRGPSGIANVSYRNTDTPATHVDAALELGYQHFDIDIPASVTTNTGVTGAPTKFMASTGYDETGKNFFVMGERRWDPNATTGCEIGFYGWPGATLTDFNNTAKIANAAFDNIISFQDANAFVFNYDINDTVTDTATFQAAYQTAIDRITAAFDRAGRSYVGLCVCSPESTTAAKWPFIEEAIYNVCLKNGRLQFANLYRAMGGASSYSKNIADEVTGDGGADTTHQLRHGSPAFVMALNALLKASVNNRTTIIRNLGD